MANGQCREIEPFRPALLSPRTSLLSNVPFKILPEIFQGALQRLHSAGREGAECEAGAENLRMKTQPLQIARLSSAFFDGAQDPLRPRQSFATWRTPAAGFAREELFEVVRQTHGAGLVVQDDHRARAHAAPGLLHRGKVHF